MTVSCNAVRCKDIGLDRETHSNAKITWIMTENKAIKLSQGH